MTLYDNFMHVDIWVDIDSRYNYWIMHDYLHIIDYNTYDEK